ncbi:MAG TPA: class I SAM-dependent methyltransferase [Myxococcota bacterium]|nr:class I SAM-dependent methyltransferase [Myxococcota bacterium]
MSPGLHDLLHFRQFSATLGAFARVHLLRTGVRLGLFETLRRPHTSTELAGRLGLAQDLVAAWLRAAESQGLVDRSGEAYTVGASVRWLLDSPDAAALHAMLDQAVLSWHPRFESLPALMKGAERPLHGAAGEAARAAAASRLIEGRAFDALTRVPQAKIARRVLDVGCGYGTYLAGFLTRYRDAHGLGVELDAEVAEEARRLLREAEVSRRGEVRAGDFMTMDLPQGSFDLAMLNNNIYYFPPTQRPALFRRVLAKLAPGGVLAIQTPVPSTALASRLLGAASGGAVFDLFLRTHRNLHGLPDASSLHATLREAGFVETGEVSIVPGGAARYFWARAPS